MDKQYKAAMIVIGNEILSGRTQDKNINYVASKLVDRGIVLSEVRIIPDIEAVIIQTVNELRSRVDYVFTSGGIGPTHDDITSECIARAFGVVLEENKEARAILLAHYGQEALTSARLKMAKIPMGASLIPNPVSAAPGFIIGNVYVMAGIPSILQAMMDHIAAILKGGALVLSRTVACSITESRIADGLTEIQSKYPMVEIGSYPYFQDGLGGVNVVLRSTIEHDLDQATQDVSVMIEAIK